MSERIQWSASERYAVACAYQANIASGMSKMKALAEAQSRAIASSRQRNLPSVTVLPWLTKPLDVLISEWELPLEEALAISKEFLRSSHKPQTNKDQKTNSSDRGISNSKPHDFLDGITSLLKVGRDESDPRTNQAYSAFFAVIKSTLLDVLDDPEILAKIRAGNTIQLERAPSGPDVAVLAEKKLKAVVLGLLNTQTDPIQEMFGDDFELLFWGKTDSLNKLRSHLLEVDFAVGLAEFLPSSSVNLIKELSIPFIRCSGNTAAVSAVLRQLRGHNASEIADAAKAAAA